MLKIKKHGILLEPTLHKFESYGVFNPACILSNGQIHLIYRATNKANYSTLGYCRLKSPLEIEVRYEAPFLVPQHQYESQGMEDPRIVEIEGIFHMSYTAYNGENALGALAVSKDLKKFTRKGIITPQMSYKDFHISIESCDGINNKYLRFVKTHYKHGGSDSASKLLVWDKDVVFFPKKINGKYAFLHRIYPNIQIAYYNKLDDLNYEYWKEYLVNIKKYTVLEGKMPFETSYIGGGCPPIETPDGWLLIYHGVEDTPHGYVYHAAAALMDLNDPTKEIGRLKKPLFSPEKIWEKKGVVDNVVFPTATILQEDTLYIYYGAADKRIAVASVKLKTLINKLKNNSL